MKRPIKIVIALVITIALVWWLLTIVSVRDIWAALASVGLWWLLVSFALYILSTTLRAARFMALVPGIGLGRMLRIVYLHNLSNQILPSFIGEFSFVYLCRNTGKCSTGHATAALVVSRVFDLAAVFGLTLVALLLYPNAPPQFRLLLWAFGAFILAVFVLLLVFVIFHNSIDDFLERLLAKMRIGHWRTLRWGLAKLHEMAHGLRSMHGTRNYVICATTSLFVWLLAYCQTYVLLYAMGYMIGAVPVSFVAAMLGTSIYRIASNLPVYGIGGFGTVEITWSAAFILLGMSVQAAVVSGFAIHIIGLAYAVLLGVMATFLHGAAKE